MESEIGVFQGPGRNTLRGHEAVEHPPLLLPRAHVQDHVRPQAAVVDAEPAAVDWRDLGKAAVQRRVGPHQRCEKTDASADLPGVASGDQRQLRIADRRRELGEHHAFAINVMKCAAAGEQRYRFALEDAYAAGRLVYEALGRRRTRKGLNDAALVAVDLVRRYGMSWERPFALCVAGRHLTRLGMANDVADAGRENAYPVLPLFHERRITAVPGPTGVTAA